MSIEYYRTVIGVKSKHVPVQASNSHPPSGSNAIIVALMSKTMV